MELSKKLSHEEESTSYKIITKRKNGTLRVQTFNEDPPMTDPQWTEESDINYIMDKFQKTGQLTHTSNRQGVYADVSQIPDLLGAAIIVKEAQDNFNALPSQIREKFKNDPQEMINFLQDPKNAEEAVKLGLLNKQELKNDNSNDEKNAPSKKQAKQKTDPPAPKTEPE